MASAPKKRSRSDTVASGGPSRKKTGTAKGKGCAASGNENEKEAAGDEDDAESGVDDDDDFEQVEATEDFLQGKPKTQKAQDRIRRRLNEAVSEIVLKPRPLTMLI